MLPHQVMVRIPNQEPNPSQFPVHINSNRPLARNQLILKLGKIVLLMDLTASIPLLILLFNMSMGSFSFIFLLMSFTFAFLSSHAGASLHGRVTCIPNALKLVGVVFIGLGCLLMIPTLYEKARFDIWLVLVLLWLTIIMCFMNRYINAIGETVFDHQSTGNTEELVRKLGKIIFLTALLEQGPYLILLNIETEPFFFLFFLSAVMFSFLSVIAGYLLRGESESESTGLSNAILILSVVSLGFGSWTVMPVLYVKARLTIWFSFTLLWISIIVHFLHKYVTF